MAEFGWQLDVADGVLKNHTLSMKIREAAIAGTKFVPYCQPEPGYGRKKGDTITITRIRNIAEPTSGRILETDRIPIDTFQQSAVGITVNEYGRGVEYTSKADLLIHYDLEDRIQRKLRQQLELVMDTAAAAAFKTAKVIFQPTSPTGGTFTTTGTPAVTALANGTVSHVKVIRDYMMDTIHVPGYGGGDRLMCLASTKFLRGIRNDPEFLAWRQFGRSEEAFDQAKIGSIENVDFVEVNHTAALANNKGTGSVLGEAVFFGDDAVAMAIVEDPELRAAIPGDFGRQKAVAWYGLLEFGIIWDTSSDGEARIVRVTSA